MLKDDIKKREELIKKIKKDSEGDFISHEIKGEVEIKAWKNGELFHHDGGNNTVTVWAKHALIRFLTGDSFSSRGTDTSGVLTRYTQPSKTPENHSSMLSASTNIDGSIMSGLQYFWDYADYVKYYINRTSVGTDPAVADPADETPPAAQRAVDDTGRIYPFFPTKMLFGTGIEFPAGWDNLTNDWKSFLGLHGYSISNFDTNISNNENYYSNTVNGIIFSQTKTRTVTDKVTTQLIDIEADYENHYGIDGAIKDCLARTQTTTVDIRDTSGAINLYGLSPTVNKILPSYNGVGRPAFIYCKRSDHWFDTDTSEILVKSDDTKKDNRVTFTVVLPEQTGDSLDFFYPYNGHGYIDTGMTLKQAGLFCDARLTIEDVIPGTGEPTELPYNYMSGGIMMAKRKISPITKTKDIRISISWSLFL